MPQHGPYHTPVLEFAGWLVSVSYRPIRPLVDVVEYYGIALVDALERRARWLGGLFAKGRPFVPRARRRVWRWQTAYVLAFVACAVVAALAVTR